MEKHIAEDVLYHFQEKIEKETKGDVLLMTAVRSPNRPNSKSAAETRGMRYSKLIDDWLDTYAKKLREQYIKATGSEISEFFAFKPNKPFYTWDDMADYIETFYSEIDEYALAASPGLLTDIMYNYANDGESDTLSKTEYWYIAAHVWADEGATRYNTYVINLQYYLKDVLTATH